jgi:NADH-quinone oxidoreductase subunit M
MLFFAVGLLAQRGGSVTIGDYGGVAKATPLLAGLFLVAGLTTLSLPGTNSFVSEFLVLIGAFPREPVYTVLATVGMVFAALYVLWVYQRVFTGPLRGVALAGDGPGTASAAAMGSSSGGTARSRFTDLNARELSIMAPLVVLVIVLGVFPGPILRVLEPTVTATMSEVGVPDPVSPMGVQR